MSTASKRARIAAFSAGDVSNMKLRVASGVPYVAYRDGANGNKATVMKYDSVGGDWMPVGEVGFSSR